MNYQDERWLNLRAKILARDNYTCQICNDFNPQLGTVEVSNPNDTSLELHSYLNSPAESIYRITSQNKSLTIELDFGTDWLTLPLLQVHHKLYIEGKEIWDYDEAHLITLCKQCHTHVHFTEQIPYYSNKGELIEYKKYNPIDVSSGGAHNYKSWVFIRKGSKNNEYILAHTDIAPTIKYIVFDHQDAREIAETADSMRYNFFKIYLSDYKQK